MLELDQHRCEHYQCTAGSAISKSSSKMVTTFSGTHVLVHLIKQHLAKLFLIRDSCPEAIVMTSKNDTTGLTYLASVSHRCA